MLVTLAAVPLSITKPYMKLWNRGRYNNIFNKYGSGTHHDRIYIPLTSAGTLRAAQEPEVPAVVEQELTKRGFKVAEYKVGLAVDERGRQMKIGKIIKDNQEAKRAFDNDPQRATVKVQPGWVVISRHPYDIIGMSFDRGWTSCMNVKEGGFRKALKADVKYGTLVAYLLKNNDRNINNPIARIALRPAFNRAGQVALMAGPVYGTASSQFSEIVDRFVEWANSGSPNGSYNLKEDLYADGGGRDLRLGPYVPSRDREGRFIVDLHRGEAYSISKVSRESDLRATLDLLFTENLFFRDGYVTKRASKPDVLKFVLRLVDLVKPTLVTVLYDYLHEKFPRETLVATKAIYRFCTSSRTSAELQLRLLKDYPSIAAEAIVSSRDSENEMDPRVAEAVFEEASSAKRRVLLTNTPDRYRFFNVTPALAERGLKILNVQDQIRMLQEHPVLMRTAPSIAESIIKKIQPSLVIEFLIDALDAARRAAEDEEDEAEEGSITRALYISLFSKPQFLPFLLKGLPSSIDLPKRLEPVLANILDRLSDEGVAFISDNKIGIDALYYLTGITGFSAQAEDHGALYGALVALLERTVSTRPAFFVQKLMKSKADRLLVREWSLETVNWMWPKVRELVLKSAATEWEALCRQLLREFFDEEIATEKEVYSSLFKAAYGGTTIGDDFAIWAATSPAARDYLIKWSRRQTQDKIKYVGRLFFSRMASRLDQLSMLDASQRLLELRNEIMSSKS